MLHSQPVEAFGERTPKARAYLQLRHGGDARYGPELMLLLGLVARYVSQGRVVSDVAFSRYASRVLGKPIRPDRIKRLRREFKIIFKRPSEPKAKSGKLRPKNPPVVVLVANWITDDIAAPEVA